MGNAVQGRGEEIHEGQTWTENWLKFFSEDNKPLSWKIVPQNFIVFLEASLFSTSCSFLVDLPYYKKFLSALGIIISIIIIIIIIVSASRKVGLFMDGFKNTLRIISQSLERTKIGQFLHILIHQDFFVFLFWRTLNCQPAFRFSVTSFCKTYSFVFHARFLALINSVE